MIVTPKVMPLQFRDQLSLHLFRDKFWFDSDSKRQLSCRDATPIIGPSHVIADKIDRFALEISTFKLFSKISEIIFYLE